jgi:hypothetical protein
LRNITAKNGIESLRHRNDGRTNPMLLQVQIKLHGRRPNPIELFQQA